MSQILEQFASELRAALSQDAGDQGKRAVCDIVARWVLDDQFVSQHLPDRREGEPVREVLYEDEQLGFCICGHVFPTGQNAEPHDHGPSWAVYGQVTGQTEMTDWKIVDSGSSTEPKRVVTTGNPYVLNPGDVHLYDVGAVHSLVRKEPIKTIRIEGQNLDRVDRSHIVKA